MSQYHSLQASQYELWDGSDLVGTFITETDALRATSKRLKQGKGAGLLTRQDAPTGPRFRVAQGAALHAKARSTAER